MAGRLEWRLAGEGLAAATTAAGVRVDEGEAAAFHAVDEVHGHTVEQRCAGVVDQHGEGAAVDLLVPVEALLFQLQAVLQPAQPPPSTRMRKPAVGLSALLMKRLIALLALSVR